MAYQIKLTQRAEEEYQKNIEYIALEFGVKKALDVEEKYFRIIKQITLNPVQFPYFNKRKKIRKCVISSQTTLYYRLDADVVIRTFYLNKIYEDQDLKMSIGGDIYLGIINLHTGHITLEPIHSVSIPNEGKGELSCPEEECNSNELLNFGEVFE